ncbi:MAG: hypothetical protein FWG13_02190 [Leptospirales bacterium]|nr:hypothetical protein [Leptospirales bacterium]
MILGKYLEKYWKKIFIYASIGIIAMSILIRIIMYIKCRSLWADEAAFAESIVSRNWLELLTPPLSNMQSAPVLYVIAVKAICSIFGYSEFSLRILSLFSFVSLLICETIFLKKAFNFNNYRIAFVVVMTALLPSYIWYSNELKPYMGDAFFVVLTILLYYFYIQDKIKLPTLTALCILILGFSSPSIFFIAGILFFEFLSAIVNKNKKQIFSIAVSGIVILAAFGLYYYWWMSPVSKGMKAWWWGLDTPGIIKILRIFNVKGNSDSTFVWFFVPFALLGIFSLCKLKNKIAYSVALSLFFTFLASSIGYWPLTGRLWLFLPAIVLIFTPIGIGFIHDKVNSKKIANIIEFCIFSTITIFLAINSVRYAGNKTYYPTQEINPLIYYVQKNIKEDEKLYVFPFAICAFNYKNGYNSAKIGNVAKDNIIYGENVNEWNESILGNELQSILENKKTYLIFSHYTVENIKIGNGLSVLRNYGTLTKIMDVYNTPLYYFERSE